MKFLIVSDSHGDYNYLEQIVYSNQDVDVFIHLGDYEIPEYLLNRFIFVRGNCDFLSDAPKFRDIDYGAFNIHFEHGNNIDFYNFEKYVESKECDIFLFGHTHKKFAKEIGLKLNYQDSRSIYDTQIAKLIEKNLVNLTLENIDNYDD